MATSLPNGKSVPAIGLGTFPFSGVFSKVEQETAKQIVSQFLESGGWYIETAPVYPVDRVDLGSVLRDFDRSDFFIATKCVTGKDASGNTIRSGKRDHLRAQCTGEIARLGVGHLDLLQLHTVPEDAAAEESFGTLTELRDEGLVRNVGVSNVTASQLAAFQSVGEVNFVQNRFSFIHRAQHRAIEKFCLENQILLNPYQVIERGLLTDNPPEEFREGDLRNSKYEYSGDVYHVIRAWVLESLAPIAAENGLSITELALGWVLGQPGIGIVPVGATSPGQVAKNMAVGRTLSDEALAAMDSAFADLEASIRSRVGLSVDEYRGL